MSKASKFLSYALCATFATAFIGFAFICLFAFCYSVYAPNLLRNKLNEASGFYAKADKVSYNAFTGKLTAYNVRIENPRAYAIPNFLNARKLELLISPLKILFGDVEIRDIAFDISSLKCVVLSPSKNNISDFLNSNIASFNYGDFKNFNLEVANLSFSDISDPEHRFERNFKTPLKISIKDLRDKSALNAELERAFGEADALFIYANITQFRD